MKNTVVYSILLFCLLALIQSCTKNSQDGFAAPTPAGQSFNVSVGSGQTYTFTAGYSGALSVVRQALHSQVSQTGTDENGSIIYKYNSLAGYTGADEVTLAYKSASTASEGSSGCANGGSSASTTIAIKINVTK